MKRVTRTWKLLSIMLVLLFSLTSLAFAEEGAVEPAA